MSSERDGAGRWRWSFLSEEGEILKKWRAVGPCREGGWGGVLRGSWEAIRQAGNYNYGYLAIWTPQPAKATTSRSGPATGSRPGPPFLLVRRARGCFPQHRVLWEVTNVALGGREEGLWGSRNVPRPPW